MQVNGKVTAAPDKRVEGGAVPPTCTNTGCVFCDLGEKPVRMKRQKIHYINRKIIVCENRNNL